jgi:hypothetical protein
MYIHIWVILIIKYQYWEDNWMGDKPFSEVYPNLYRIARRKAGAVANVLWTAPLNVSFRQD